MKKGLAYTVSAMILIWICLCGFTPPAATSELYVSDMVGVLDEADKDHIIQTSQALQSAFGAQIAVLTTTDLQGQEISEYARQTANAWGLGDKEKDNGLLIVLYLGDGERNIFVTVGTGLEGCLNDGKVGRFIDTYALDELKAGQYSSGIVHLYDACLSVVMQEYGIEELNGFQAQDTSETGSAGEIIMTVVVVLFVLIFFIGRRGRGFWFFGPPRGPGGFSGGGFSGGGFGGSSGGGGGFSGGGAGRGF